MRRIRNLASDHHLWRGRREIADPGDAQPFGLEPTHGQCVRIFEAERTFSLYVLIACGYVEGAASWRNWLLRAPWPQADRRSQERASSQHERRPTIAEKPANTRDYCDHCLQSGSQQRAFTASFKENMVLYRLLCPLCLKRRMGRNLQLGWRLLSLVRAFWL